jgi:ring-1,2-phenylacetyl-CoA epoxidase subunit PaaE
MKTHTTTWTISAMCSETHDTKTIFLEPLHEKLSYNAGQYLTVLLSGFEPAEGKSYSISSAPHDTYVSLTIKSLGKFSNAILSHKIGDTITTSTPYGFFYPDPSQIRPRALLAGGIGITPCFSIIRDALHQNFPMPLHLFYSNKTESDIIFKKNLEVLSAAHPRLHVHQHITREIAAQPPATQGHITKKHITTALEDTDIDDTDFFICGSISFTKDMWLVLKSIGVSQASIYTEGFF